MTDRIYIFFTKDYSAIGVFHDMDKAKHELGLEGPLHNQIAWVGVYVPNSMLQHAVPLWEPWDFVDNFPHSG
jgi:hypothetical protein